MSQQIVVPLGGSPTARFVTVAGTVDAEGIDTSHNTTLQRFTLEFNLSDLHPTALPPPLSGYSLRASAQAGLTSINNSDDAPEWTWAVDGARTIIREGKLVLVVDLAGQGGPDSEIVYHDAVLSSLTYQVSVLVS
ncbi:MAG TPA: hypothetical protein VFB89_09805 [Gemmatimonadales bacterium]|nr:hypothetical protein [Gemmatimonadales bacterium]